MSSIEHRLAMAIADVDRATFQLSAVRTRLESLQRAVTVQSPKCGLCGERFEFVSSGRGTRCLRCVGCGEVPVGSNLDVIA